MPFRSEKQRRWMWARHPRMARRWSNEEKVGKSMDLVSIQKGFLRTVASPNTFRAVNGPPLSAAKGTTLTSSSRPYQPNPLTMAAVEGLSRRRAAKQLRKVHKSWDGDDMELVEIGKSYYDVILKEVTGDKVSRRELKGKYRPALLQNFNPRSKTEVKRNTKTRRAARALTGATIGGIAGTAGGVAAGAALAAATKGKSKKAQDLAVKRATRAIQAGSTAGVVAGASAGRSANVRSEDVRAHHRRTGRKAKSIVSASSMPPTAAFYRYGKKGKEED